jgi:hypothetical protein
MKKLKDFEGKKIVVNCITLKQAKAFCKLMHNNGLTWCTEASYLKRTNWETHQENTCYYFNKGQYDSCDFYKREGYTILPATDFLEEEFIYGQEYDFSDCEDFSSKRIYKFGCMYPDNCDHDYKYLAFNNDGYSLGFKYARKINT